MTKKKWLIIGAAALVFIGVLLAVFLWLIPTLRQPDEPQIRNTPKQAVNTVMKALSGEGTNERILLGTDGTPVSIAPGSGIAQLITSQLEYEIKALNVSGDKAEATLQITAPDALFAVQAALEGMESYEEALFLERMEARLENLEAKRDFTVQVELVLVEDRWCVVTNPEFSDAITGGLISRYLEVQKAIMDAFAGGETE